MFCVLPSPSVFFFLGSSFSEQTISSHESGHCLWDNIWEKSFFLLVMYYHCAQDVVARCTVVKRFEHSGKACVLHDARGRCYIYRLLTFVAGSKSYLSEEKHRHVNLFGYPCVPDFIAITDTLAKHLTIFLSSHGQKRQEWKEGEGSREDSCQNGEKGFKEVQTRRGDT